VSAKHETQQQRQNQADEARHLLITLVAPHVEVGQAEGERVVCGLKVVQRVGLVVPPAAHQPAPQAQPHLNAQHSVSRVSTGGMVTTTNSEQQQQ
jgi:hypothetical protein